MRQIAFKIAGQPTSNVKGSLPDNFITEWTYLDQQSSDFDFSDYTILNEDEFMLKWNINFDLLIDWKP